MSVRSTTTRIPPCASCAGAFTIWSKRDAARQAEYAGKNAISFGSQIRTYTLQPYRLVKDHRSNCEIGDTDAVLDGRIDKLLRDYLLWQHTTKQQR